MVEESPLKLLVDEAEFGPQAEAMVEQQLRSRGIGDRRVLEAMRSVPRHRFVEPQLHRRAYADAALPTLNGQTISQPYMVAAMTEALELTPGHRALEIGTGTGYQTMVLARLCERVVSVERDADLAEQARGMLNAFGIENVAIHVGDGTLGWAGEAPYDRILVTAGAPQEPPPALLDQLTDGGVLVIPLGDREMQSLYAITKRAGRLERERLLGCRFVPLVGEQGWEGE